MTVRIFVGFDQREAIAYHTFCQSIIERSSNLVSFHPLALRNLRNTYAEMHRDGSNEFIYSRFLVPALCDFQGWALFCDGDMIVQDDIYKLWQMRNSNYAAQVVQHDYKTRYPFKYLGARNEDYPRKNWSSVILWNCSHPANRILTPDMVSESTGSYLHRFSWLPDHLIGRLPIGWNHLVGELPPNPEAPLLHYTIGTPCFNNFRDFECADRWHAECAKVNHAQSDF